MAPRVEIIKMDKKDMFTNALLFLIIHAYKNGIQEAGDQGTLMLPPGVEIGFEKDGPNIDLGEWEITIKKVS